MEKYKAIWTKIEDLKIIELNALLVSDDSYKSLYQLSWLKYARRWYRMQSFTVICIDSLLVYVNKYYLQLYLDNYAYKVVCKQMADYLDENVFED